MLRLPLILAVLCAPSATLAQDTPNGLSFRFGIGPDFGPSYFGDADSDGGIAAKFELERFQLGSLSIGGADTEGLSFGGSVRFIGARDADDFSELDGMDMIDPSLEVGGRVEYTTPNYAVFAKLRYGAIGHEAFVAELGGDLQFRPTDRLAISAGPRVLMSDDSYAQTYFGVSGAESGASGFDPFVAQGGIISAGAKAEAVYSLNDDWQIVGTVTYDQFLADAADSPLTEADDQLSGSIVLTRRITFGF